MICIGHSPIHQISIAKWWVETALLSFDYVNNRYMVGGNNVSLTSTHDVTRASDGYFNNIAGDWSAFGNDIAKRTNRGLLVEPDGTNLLKRSNEFESSHWVKLDGCSVVENAAIAPDGTNTATRVSFADNNISRVEQVLNNLIEDQTYTFSIFMRSTGTDVLIKTGTSGSNADEFENVTVTSSWQRFSISNPASDTTEYPRIQNASGDAGVEVDVWIAQYETGYDASSPIITENSPATRVSDIITAHTIATTLATMTRGILVLDLDILGANEGRHFSISDGSTQAQIGLKTNAEHEVGLFAFVDGNVTMVINFGVMNTNRTRFAIGIKNGEALSVSFNGEASLLGALTPDLNRLTACQIGGQFVSSSLNTTFFHTISSLNEDPVSARLEELSKIV